MKHRKFLFLNNLQTIILFALLLPIVRAELTPSPDDWRDQVIYQIITDRFFDGEYSNNTANPSGTYNPSGGWDIHGGDFKGIQQKLDYLKSLGVTALWISPVLYNQNGAYHGYCTIDFNRIDPHWGALSDLQQLVQQAHLRGIYINLDIICNHGGDLIYSTDGGYPNYTTSGYNLSYRSATHYAAPFDNLAYFHNYGNIGNWSDPEQILGELSGLDDFKTELTSIRTTFISIYSNLFDTTDIDGIRIDTVKHVDLGFWQTWAPAIRTYLAPRGKINFFMYGEVYDGDDSKCASYVNSSTLTSILDYPLYFTTNGVFADLSAATDNLDNRYTSLTTRYPAEAQSRLVTFLDNHDQPRFLSSSHANDDQKRLEVALVFQLTSRGVPCIYYGTEQGFNGSGDPNCREDMFDGQFESGPSLGDNFNQTHALFLLVQKLNNLRRLYSPLRRGTQTTLQNSSSGTGIYAYSRQEGSSELIIILNTATASKTTNALPTSYTSGTKLLNLLNSSDTVTINASNQIPILTIGAQTARIYLPVSQVQSLNPTILKITPAHDSKNIAVNTTIAVMFNMAMNTTSVQQAFSTSPSSSGSFNWIGNQMTYTPSSSFLGNQLYTVRIATTARALTGLPLFGTFESIFATGTGLPPQPPSPIGPLSGTYGKITIDGLLNDWRGTAGIQGTGTISSTGTEFIWKDEINDDTGDGDYTYPTDATFTGGDADIDEFRIAWDTGYLYFLFKAVSINTAASFFTPYFGVAIDTDRVYGSGRTALGIEGGIANGGADAVLSGYLASEFEVAVPGVNSVVMTDKNGNIVSTGVKSAYNKNIGVTEIAVPLSTIGNPAGKTWSFVPYAALETYNGIREIQQYATQWNPGGGFNNDADGNEPDIFDLVGNSATEQLKDLNSYVGSTPAVIVRCAISITFGNIVPVGLSKFSCN
ncbi:MAG: alpha-amylase family glycosyl hydrolase [bacterium]